MRVRWQLQSRATSMERFLLIFLATMLFVIVFIGILARYTPLTGQMLGVVELGRLFLLWTSLLAAAMVQRKGTHFQFDSLLGTNKGRLGYCIRVFIDFVVMVSFGLLAWASYTFCQISLGSTTEVLHWPLIISSSSLAIGISLMLAYVIVSLMRSIRGVFRSWNK